MIKSKYAVPPIFWNAPLLLLIELSKLLKQECFMLASMTDNQFVSHFLVQGELFPYPGQPLYHEYLMWLGTQNDFVYIWTWLREKHLLPANELDCALAAHFMRAARKDGIFRFKAHSITSTRNKLKSDDSDYQPSFEALRLISNFEKLLNKAD